LKLLAFSDISLVQIFVVFIVQTAIEVVYYAYIVAILCNEARKRITLCHLCADFYL